MEPIWEQGAKTMLNQRDRFTYPEVADEFRSYSSDLNGLLSRSIQFDDKNDGYLTPVLRDRYSVVWYLNDDEQPVVHAVVPTARFRRDTSDLKAVLEQIVSKASDNLVTLK